MAFNNGEVSTMSLDQTLFYCKQTEQEYPPQLLIEAVDKVVNKLSRTEANVIDLFFGLTRENPLSLEEISSVTGLPVEKIEQIKGVAIEELRNRNVCEELRKFVYY